MSRQSKDRRNRSEYTDDQLALLCDLVFRRSYNKKDAAWRLGVDPREITEMFAEARVRKLYFVDLTRTAGYSQLEADMQTAFGKHIKEIRIIESSFSEQLFDEASARPEEVKKTYSELGGRFAEECALWLARWCRGNASPGKARSPRFRRPVVALSGSGPIWNVVRAFPPTPAAITVVPAGFIPHAARIEANHPPGWRLFYEPAVCALELIDRTSPDSDGRWDAISSLPSLPKEALRELAAFWKRQSVIETLALARNADVFVTYVSRVRPGSNTAEAYDHLGYPVEKLKAEGAIGLTNYTVFNTRGQPIPPYVKGRPLFPAIALDELQAMVARGIPVVAATGGPYHAPQILVALRSGFINVLVTCHLTARWLLAHKDDALEGITK